MHRDSCQTLHLSSSLHSAVAHIEPYQGAKQGTEEPGQQPHADRCVVRLSMLALLPNEVYLPTRLTSDLSSMSASHSCFKILSQYNLPRLPFIFRKHPCSVCSCFYVMWVTPVWASTCAQSRTPACRLPPCHASARILIEVFLMPCR